MSALLAALFKDHQRAQGVRTQLVKDGFPTDRVELISGEELGSADVVPAQSKHDKLTRHFRQIFEGAQEDQCAQALARAVLAGQAAIIVQPRGEVETQRATEILEQGGPVDVLERDLDKQSMEHAASKSEATVLPKVGKILIGPERH
jgi:hypothetical protein